jgi:hypothetical protein
LTSDDTIRSSFELVRGGFPRFELDRLAANDHFLRVWRPQSLGREPTGSGLDKLRASRVLNIEESDEIVPLAIFSIRALRGDSNLEKSGREALSKVLQVGVRVFLWFSQSRPFVQNPQQSVKGSPTNFAPSRSLLNSGVDVR